MVLTTKQEEGLRQAVTKYHDNEPYVCISGYAGTGKSTLVKFIIAALGVDPEVEVAYIAYTGKAAEVLRKKGCPNATTAHKLIYETFPLSNGKFLHRPKISLGDYKVIVVDEISMLPKDMWQQLLSYRVFIIACGDPFQIPPISSDDDNLVLKNPHVFLDEIMRQAENSEIIRLSMDIRQLKSPKHFVGNDVQILNANELVTGMYEWADQIICSTNRRRKEINNYMRASLGRGELPEEGDKIICLRNNWELLSSENNPLVNGSTGILRNPRIQIERPPYFISNKSFKTVIADMIIDDKEVYNCLPMDLKVFTEGEKTFNSKQEFQLSRTRQRTCSIPMEFDYGYAISGHRAQGSEWEKVLIIEESFPFSQVEHARWLYTALTRASEKAVIIRKN